MQRFVKLGPPGPLRTHFTFHLHDWIGLLVLIILDSCLNLIHPFKRFVGEFFINDVRFPLKSNTVPLATVPVIAVGIPLAFFIAYYIYKRDIRDLHQAVLGLLYAVLITAVITDAVKDGVGRPRPNFFWRCFPDGIGVYDNTTRAAICNGDRAVVKEGYKSFPSGHTSWSFAGLGYLSMYFAGKLEIFDRRGRVGKLIIVTTPLLLATLVGVSRVDDYWHHWQDVFAGAILGLIVSYICYRQHFPSLYDDRCMEPYPCIAVRVADWPPEANGTPTRDLEVGRSVEDSSF